MSSRIDINDPSISTRSGLAEGVVIFKGSVDGCESEALRVGISTYNVEDDGRSLLMQDDRQFNIESWRHVYLPCIRAS